MSAFPAGTGSALQGCVSLVVAGDQEAALLVVDHLGAADVLLGVAACCDHVQQGVTLDGDHGRDWRRRWGRLAL